LARQRIRAVGGGRLAPELVAERLEERARGLGGRNGLTLRSGRGLGEHSQVMLADGIGSAALAARLAQDPDVEYAAVDAPKRVLAVPNDPLYLPSTAPPNGPASGQWYLRAPQANALTTGN